MVSMHVVGAGIALVVASAVPAVAGDLPIRRGRWTDAVSCTDPSAGDYANVRVFSPGRTSTPNDECRIAIGQVSGNKYTTRLTCTYTQGGGGILNVLITVISPSEIRWKDLGSAFDTRYRYCGRS